MLTFTFGKSNKCEKNKNNSRLILVDLCYNKYEEEIARLAFQFVYFLNNNIFFTFDYK